MSTFEAPYKSLLQGVSQQLPEERLPGQVTAQTNMVSDPVTNLRRRPGVVMKKAWEWAGADAKHVLSWFTDLAGARVHILLNTLTGNIRILNEDYVEEASLAAGAYLTNSDVTRIRAAAVGNEFFLANLDVVPALQFAGGGPNPANAGFFYIVSGAFSKSYSIAINHGGGQFTASYTTPSGAGAGDAALSTPEYIATQLVTGLGSPVGLTVVRDGPYVFITYTSGISVNTSSGSQYMLASKGGVMSAEGDLPARLPAAGNGHIIRIGTGSSAKYFKYSSTSTEWVESGDFASASSITGCPISIIWTGSAWALNTDAFEGRLSGDDKNNKPHEWMLFGMTGMATYQGRLVFLSGPMVALSASGEPRRFFRSTVTNVISSDPIEIGSGMNSAAAYEWAVPFQKDLILFSRAYQALIPSGNQAISPATATVVPTSSHEGDTTCGPITAGRTLMYPNPRSEDFFGVLEMLPSSFTDSQYTSQDSTPHLPKYMPGRCRFAVSSGVASLALFAPSGDPQSLIVHEYHWDGDTKAQQAWHQWTFPYPVASAYFASDIIVLTFVKNGVIVLGTIDPRAGALNAASERRPFLDLNISAAITAHNIPIPAWMLAFDPDIAKKLVAVVLSGSLAGERVGATPAVDGLSLTTVLSWPSGGVGLGLPYYSGVTPGSPVVTDYSNEVIHSGKATLLRYLLGTRNSSEFMVEVSDDYSMEDPQNVATVAWSSPELALGTAPFSKKASVVVPCRTELRSTVMEVYTQGTGELNVTSLEYVAKFHAKIKRK